MDYSNWTDFAINVAVGAATGEAKNSEPLLSLVIRNSNGRRYDPCNNAADAWPIIFESGISLRKLHNGKWRAINEWGDSHQHDHENPLRAAMVVFLMMQESE